MKIILSLFLAIVLFTIGCKKDKPVKNGTLYDKPLGVIKHSIQGHWQLHYMYGGYSGSFREDFNNSFITFNGDHILWTVNDTVWVNSNIDWVYDISISSQKTYLMQFGNAQNSFDWLVDGIYNDTLVLYDNFTDSYSYHLTKK